MEPPTIPGRFRYSAISATLIGCSTARNKCTCDNRVNIRRDELESRVLNALRTRLVDPALFARFCEVFTQEVNRLRMEGRANVAAAEAEIRKIDRELETLLDLILKGGAADRINTKMVGLVQRKKEVEAFLAEAADIIRTLVEDIVLTPVDGKVEIDVRGDLAGILTLSVQTKNPAGGAGSSQVKMVAGVGFEPTTFRL